MLTQAKYNNDLYVIEKIPYQITADTDVDIIYVPMDSVEGYKELNPTLPIEGYSYSTIKVNREPYQDYLEVICTSESNAPLMTLLHTKGLAANENYMTLAEAKAVTNEQLDGLLNGNTTVESFNEFKYFTNVTKVGTSDDAEESKTTSPFRQCTSLKYITLPPTVNELGARAFDLCKNVERINGLENVHIFGHCCLQATFGNVSTQIIDTIKVKELKGALQFNNVYKATNGYGVKNLIIQGDITEIPRSSFNGLLICESITIPESVITIGGFGNQEANCFSACISLRRLNSDIDGIMNIPNNVTEIGWQSFYVGGTLGGNHTIKEINIPDSVIRLGGTALGSYYGCERLNLGSGLQTIDANALMNIGTDNEILMVTVKATTPPTITGRLNFNDNNKIFVPAESVEAYKAADGWGEYADTIFPMNN